MEEISFTIVEEEEGMRVDRLVATRLKHLSRTKAQQLIENEKVLLADKPTRASTKVRTGDLIKVRIPTTTEQEIQPEPIPLHIIYEDEDILVVNKPQGMVVHPAPGNFSGTLVNGLLYHCKNLSEINGGLRPGIVHRLDKDTSGILMVAKNNKTHHHLVNQLKKRKVFRQYIALVHGNVAEEGGFIDAPIGRHPVNRKKMAVTEKNSKPAMTEYKVKERFGNFTLLEVCLHTGRTHQIRVHLSYIKKPILGDSLYGPQKNPFGIKAQALHAYRLGFQHPKRGEYMEFVAPMPTIFKDLLKNLRTSALLGPT